MKRVWHLPELTTKARIGAIVATVVIIIIVLTFIITSTISRQLTDSAGSAVQQDFTKKDTATRQNDARSSAATAIASGDDKTAATIYKRALDAEKDPTRKVKLAIDQSKLLSYAGKFDEAVDVAKSAEAYSDDKYLINDWLARLYAKGKRYSDAATYYEKAGELVASPTNAGRYEKKYYDDNAVTMKSLAAKK
ncbi:MAG: hypothetical protein JWN75_992 [Candidatus Saccharibacteria bacterium]|nr:hypothetical protein [Candidatus Saccharibacteria bacterium]